jgi:uncharacterized protein YceH (UPF0502 family)
MESLTMESRSERRASRPWVYASLAVLLAAATTWALYVTQDTWRSPASAAVEMQRGAEASNAEIEALEAELARIQKRLDELRSEARP